MCLCVNVVDQGREDLKCNGRPLYEARMDGSRVKPKQRWFDRWRKAKKEPEFSKPPEQQVKRTRLITKKELG